MINTSLQAGVVTIAGAVRGRNLNGNGSRSCKKCEPFIVVQHPVAAASREVLLNVIIVDGVAIPVQVIAKDRRLLASVS